jgi:hypothetical protein
MTIDDGTAIVLAYVLVSMGVIIAFLLAAFVIGWFIVGCASAADQAPRPPTPRPPMGWELCARSNRGRQGRSDPRRLARYRPRAHVAEQRQQARPLRGRSDAHLRRSRVNAIDASNDK